MYNNLKTIWQKMPHNFFIAIEAIYQNKFRAFLTSLGILFGVASVIAMLAIGSGAQQEILSQIRLLGTNNIIITPIVEQEEGTVADQNNANQQAAEKKRYSPGLTLADAQSIQEIVPHVNYVSPEVVVESVAIRAGLRRSAKLVGITDKYFHTSEFSLESGDYFSEYQQEHSLPVCVIGQSISAKFFPSEDPIGKQIKVGNLWLTVIGVLNRRYITQENIQHLGIRDYNMDIYIPINTMLIRFRNRAAVTREEIITASRNNDESLTAEDLNYNQLDRLIVRVDDVEYMSTMSDVISRMLERRHFDIVDFQVVIPEMLLQQEQRTRTIFNIVLGAIASISLIVGGIGIMNIMLASVMERIKEIGVRLAIGATQMDIILQFIGEAVAISITGGIAGIILGFLMSSGIEKFTGILTVVSPVSVLVSVIVSVTVGLVFGIFPARKAAAQDPIVSLRYE